MAAERDTPALALRKALDRVLGWVSDAFPEDLRVRELPAVARG